MTGRVPADQTIIDLLDRRVGRLTEVVLADGRQCRVFNVAWGYDDGDESAHVTSNCSPFKEGEDIDLFLTADIALIRDGATGELLYGDDGGPTS